MFAAKNRRTSTHSIMMLRPLWSAIDDYSPSLPFSVHPVHCFLCVWLLWRSEKKAALKIIIKRSAVFYSFFLLDTKCCTFPLPDHILASSLSHANQQKRPTLGSVFLLSTLLANWNSLYSKQPATLYLLVSSWRVKWIVKSICRHIWLTHNHCTNEHNKVLNRLTEKNQTVTNAEVKKYSAVS